MDLPLPDVLNVAIGLVVLYFLLSTIGATIVELLSRALRYREEILIATVNGLLTGQPARPWSWRRLLWDRLAREILSLPVVNTFEKWLKWIVPRNKPWPTTGDVVKDRAIVTVRKKFWEHPKLKSLKANSLDAPSEIEPETFAQIIVDLVAKRDAQGALPKSKVAFEQRLAANNGYLPDALLASARDISRNSNIPDNVIGEQFWEPYYKRLGAWYAETMENASARYKRATQRWLLVIGLAMAFILNADTIRVVYLLSLDEDLRESVADFADDLLESEEKKKVVVETGADAKPEKEELKEDFKELQKLVRLGFPIGWTENQTYDYFPFASKTTLELKAENTVVIFGLPFGALAYKFIGLLLTAFAVNMGAPFWHNLLGKLLSFKKKLPPAAAESTATKDKKSKQSSAAEFDVSDNPVPLEINRDLVASSIGLDPRKAYWLAEASLLAYQSEQIIARKVTEEWFLPTPKMWDVKQKNVDTQVFAVATDEVVFVSFRGTEPKEFNDIITDAKFKQKPLAGHPDLPQGVEVHSGFYDALDVVYSSICDWLSENKVNDKALYVTGHSLGGALSLLLAFRLAENQNISSERLTVYNYGCPRIGNEAFAACYDRTIGTTTFRVVHGNDIVTKVPPAKIGFRHVGSSLYLRKPDGTARNVPSVDRLLDFAVDATDDLKGAAESSVADHSMEEYAARCLKLTGAMVG